VSVRASRSRIRRAVSRRAAVDARALAALRIALGALLLLDLALRARNLAVFYTDAGVLPRDALVAQHPVARYSLHALSGALWWEALLFVVAGVFAVSLLVGYRTRLVTFVSLVLLVSLHLRNPVVLNGGDSLFRRLLLWSVFLPLGRRWSVDAHRTDDGPNRVISVASAGLLLQVTAVYVVNAVLKLRGDAWPSGDAVRYVFSLDQFTVFLGDVLPHVPVVLTAMDYAWLALLCLSPLLVLATGRVRGALAAGLMAAHVGMVLTLKLGIFPVVTVAALLPFLSSAVWDRVERHVPENPFSRLDAALPYLPRPSVPPLVRRGPTVLATLLVAFVLVWNAAALGFVHVSDDAAVNPADNSWDMFAPEPLHADGWYVTVGYRANGESVDPYRGGPVDFSKPPDVSETYPTARWRKYLVSLAITDDRVFRDEFAGYLCRHYDATHDDSLTAVSVYFVEQETRLDGPEPVHRTAFGNYTCPT